MDCLEYYSLMRLQRGFTPAHIAREHQHYTLEKELNDRAGIRTAPPPVETNLEEESES